MASFVIHTIAGKKLLEQLYNRGYIISEDKKNNFLLGNLIPDSTRINCYIPTNLTEDEIKNFKKMYKEQIQQEKIQTHFRNNDDLEKCIQYPDINLFLTKYTNLVNTDFSALGYLFHLYTDVIFFNNLFSQTFRFLDKNFKTTQYSKDAKYVVVNKNNKVYTVTEFWNSNNNESIYHDYTLINKKLLEYFNINININDLLYSTINFQNPGITEVDYENIIKILVDTHKYIEESIETKNSALNIFSEEQIIKFISDVCNKFIDTYEENIKNCFFTEKTSYKEKIITLKSN